MRARKVILVLFTVALLGAAPASARAEDPGLVAARDHYLRDRTGLMAGLTTWAALNILGGAALWVTAPPSREDPVKHASRRSFAAMAVAYGLVNGIIAVNTLASLGKSRQGLATLGDITEQRRQSSNVFTVNVGLDMLSVGVGAAIWAYGPPGTAQGAGASVTAQGLFLVGFDTMGSLVYRY